MANDIFDYFNQKAITLFQQTLESYGYIREEVEIKEINGARWSTHLTFVNPAANLKIIIKQEPCYTDYGFSFFIYKLGTNQYNILYNVPHERQDGEGNFLNTAYEDLFSTPETLDLITGKLWKELKRIPFLK
jgi:hypothetical protein